MALAKDGKTIFCSEISEQGYSHAEKLHVFIEEILLNAGISSKDLNAIAISSGPGSYTGLRIGVSAAKGLCYALDIPLISVDTLTSLTSQAKVTDGIVIPMIDARRMEVYSAIFNANNEIIRKVEAEILTESSFDNFAETIYFVGDSNEKAKAVLNKPNFVFLDEIVYPSAKDMSVISYKKFTQNSFEDLAYYEPYYLKDFMFAK